MPKLIVLLSGRVCAGKTTLALRLTSAFADKFKVKHVKTFDLLKRLGAQVALERGAMQEFGERLDSRTGGAWVCDELLRDEQNYDDNAIILLDSVRILGQIEAIRKAYGKRVIHIHLDANLSELQKRYGRRNSKEMKELASYDEVQKNKTERNVPKLARSADVVILTDRCTEEDVLIRAASHVGFMVASTLGWWTLLLAGSSEARGKVRLPLFWRENTSCWYALAGRTRATRFIRSLSHTRSTTFHPGRIHRRQSCSSSQAQFCTCPS